MYSELNVVFRNKCGLHLRWLPLKYSEYAPLPQPTPPRGDPQTLTDRSGSVLWAHCSFPLGPGAHKVLFVPSKSLCFAESYGSSVIKSHCPESDSLGVPCPFAGSSGWKV